MTLSPVEGLSGWCLDIPHFDKFVHFGLFFIQTALLYSSYPRYLFAFIFGILFAALTEWLQAYVPGRSADISDFSADIAGVSVMLLMIFWLRRSKAAD